MDCVKLYLKDNLIGVLTFDNKQNQYVFIKNKFFNNKYIESVIGLNNEDEVYYSPNLFSFFLYFLKKYGSNDFVDEYEELVRIASLEFDKNQFWLGA